MQPAILVQHGTDNAGRRKFRKIIQATNYSGVIGFDLRQRDDGRFVFLECNPRFWYNMELTMLAGANFVRSSRPPTIAVSSDSTFGNGMTADLSSWNATRDFGTTWN